MTRTTVHDEAFALAAERLADEVPMRPFALIATEAGRRECVTLVTDRSDKAAHLGRRLARARADRAAAYAIATDAYVRRGDQRVDAIIVESAARGDAMARLVARPHVGAALRDDVLELGTRPSAIVDVDPFTWDWGPITSDLYDAERQLAIHVVIHELGAADDVARTIRFLRARLRRHALVLPAETTQVVHVDDRGQQLAPETRAALRRAFEHVAFTSEMVARR